MSEDNEGAAREEYASERAGTWKKVSTVRAPTGYRTRDAITRACRRERQHSRNYSRVLKYVDTKLKLYKGT